MAYYWRAVAFSTGRPKVSSLARGNGSRGMLSRGSLADIPSASLGMPVFVTALAHGNAPSGMLDVVLPLLWVSLGPFYSGDLPGSVGNHRAN
jgi:hypothetical protein